MSSNLSIRQLATEISPGDFAAVLRRVGWSQFGGQQGLYSRWRPSGDENAPSLLLPLNEEMADYRDLFQQALAALLKRESQAEKLLMRLGGDARSLGDEIRFRKEVTTIAGAIPWLQGESLINSARLALLASAKSRKSRKAYFGNTNSKFAYAFLGSVLMGQTDNSSYVVTAYAPVDKLFYERPADEGSTLPGVGSHTGRDITQTLISSLDATQEAIEHFENSQSMSGFDAGVRNGISYELVLALQGVLENSDGADISVSWKPALNLEEDSQPESAIKEFEPRHIPILEKACNRLAITSASQTVTVMGAVTLLERPNPGSPGVIRIEVVSGSPAKKIRVRLEGQQYRVAFEAHGDERGIVVTGRQEKEGRYYWLYDAQDIQPIDLPIKYAHIQAVGLGEDQTAMELE
ncbi:hypothetical protein [Streptosporangium sp. NPDC000509]|uniref:hypothetical protein n=1 Tax=Streptosporangium sp. NPDC000509 TaxID=3366186 RepID=UPI0036C38B5B